MRAKKPLLVVAFTLVILVLVLLLPSVAVAQPITYEVPGLIGLLYGPVGETSPGPDITRDSVTQGGYPRTPRVGDSMSLYYGWTTFNKGTTQTAPDYTSIELWVDGPGDYDIHITSAAAKAYWEAPTLLDPAENQPFNPSIGAEQWLVMWRYKFDLTVPGTYKVHFFQDFSRTNNDLTAIWDEDTQQWLDKFAGHLHYRPGDGLGDSFFTVVVKR
jgi:hypothetical protein